MPRKIIPSISVSLDGYLEWPGGGIGWHMVDDERLWYFDDRLRPMGAFLEGRVTYEFMAGVWPTADGDPACPAPAAEFAGIWRDLPRSSSPAHPGGRRVVHDHQAGR